MHRPHFIRFAALAFTCLACGDGSGPDLAGTPYFRVTVNGAPWAAGLPFSGCGDFALLLSVPVTTAIPDNDVLEIHVQSVSGPGTFALGDSATGRYAQTENLRSTGPIRRTVTGAGDQLVVTGISFGDSAMAGSFRFRLVTPSDPADTVVFAGTFRLPLRPLYTVACPDGTPCFGAT
jgi:hypothetical protein